MADKIWDKLVRDRIPEIIRHNGHKAVVRRLTKQEFDQAIKAKFREELRELIRAKDSQEIREELADLQELIITYAEHNGLTAQSIARARAAKAAKRGRYKKMVLLEKTSTE